MVKNPPAVKKMWLLEKKMGTHSSILAWEISWTEEPGGLQSMGLQRGGLNSSSNRYFVMATQTKALFYQLLREGYSNLQP